MNKLKDINYFFNNNNPNKSINICIINNNKKKVCLEIFKLLAFFTYLKILNSKNFG